MDSIAPELQLANRAFVPAAALFDYRNGLSHCSGTCEVTQQQNRVCKITHVDRRAHVLSENAILRQDNNGGHPLIVQKRDQLTQLHDEELLARHPREKTVQ